MTSLTLAPAGRPSLPRRSPLGAASRRRAPGRGSAAVLTRRGRVVVVLLVALAAVLAMSLAGRAGSAAAGDAVTGPATRAVVVQPGESLWTIARSVDPSDDPREVVNRLQQLNHLSGSVVVPGQSLVVPVVR